MNVLCFVVAVFVFYEANKRFAFFFGGCVCVCFFELYPQWL